MVRISKFSSQFLPIFLKNHITSPNFLKSVKTRFKSQQLDNQTNNNRHLASFMTNISSISFTVSNCYTDRKNSSLNEFILKINRQVVSPKRLQMHMYQIFNKQHWVIILSSWLCYSKRISINKNKQHMKKKKLIFFSISLIFVIINRKNFQGKLCPEIRMTFHWATFHPFPSHFHLSIFISFIYLLQWHDFRHSSSSLSWSQ